VRSLSLRWSVSADVALSEKSPYLGSAWVRWVLGGPLDVARGPPVRLGSLSLALPGLCEVRQPVPCLAGPLRRTLTRWSLSL
jgi:hypothetical protein